MTPQEEWDRYASRVFAALGSVAKAVREHSPRPAARVVPESASLTRLQRVSQVFGSEWLAQALGVGAVGQLDRRTVLALRVIAGQPGLLLPSRGLLAQLLGLSTLDIGALAAAMESCGLVEDELGTPECEQPLRVFPDVAHWLAGRTDRPPFLRALDAVTPAPHDPASRGQLDPRLAVDLVLQGASDARPAASALGRHVDLSAGPIFSIDPAAVSTEAGWRRVEAWRRLLGGFAVFLDRRGVAAPARAFKGMVIAGPGASLGACSERRSCLIRLDPEPRRDRMAHWVSLLGPDARATALIPDLVTLPAPASLRPVIAASLTLLDAPTSDDIRAVMTRYEPPPDGPLDRIVPRHRSMDDLVVPARTRHALDTAIAWLRRRERVTQEWGLRSAAGYGLGLICLFHGPPGTGKSMAAEVIAAETERPLLRIDLARVLDKYIGETEKKLKSAFDAARGQSAVLVFDEADALFAKRTDVGDARDRYANAETAYLLQLAESYDGLAILTTNNRGNLDEAFQRRILVQAGFPMPEEEERLGLWNRFLRMVPLHDDVDLTEFARRFRMSGGDIKNAVFLAALWAADGDRSVTPGDLATGVAKQLMRSGYPLPKDTFGPLWALVDGRA